MGGGYVVANLVANLVERTAATNRKLPECAGGYNSIRTRFPPGGVDTISAELTLPVLILILILITTRAAPTTQALSNPGEGPTGRVWEHRTCNVERRTSKWWTRNHRTAAIHRRTPKNRRSQLRRRPRPTPTPPTPSQPLLSLPSPCPPCSPWFPSPDPRAMPCMRRSFRPQDPLLSVTQAVGLGWYESGLRPVSTSNLQGPAVAGGPAPAATPGIG